jgi:hypothetical protein
VADHDAWIPADTLGEVLAGVPGWALEAAAADEVLVAVGADADVGQAGAALSAGTSGWASAPPRRSSRPPARRCSSRRSPVT